MAQCTLEWLTGEDYVLKAYSSPERKELPATIEVAADALESLLTTDLATTQSASNSWAVRCSRNELRTAVW